jgi:squalene-associated FAD-dependent desaturase
VRVVVIGGGFAGLAAAIELQERRHQVVLLERRGVLGGRATSFRDAATGEDVDNGTHLMIAGYREAIDLIRRAGAAELLLFQDELRLDYVDERGLTSLVCPPVAAPLHLLLGILGLRLPWRVKWQALRLGLRVGLGSAPVGLSLAEYLERAGQGSEARRLLWDPLATAILNETPERAAAVLFYNVYREAFLKSHAASRLVFLRRGWGVLHERLAGYLEARGGSVRRRALAEAVEVEDERVTGVRYLQRAETREEIQAGVAATPARASADAVVAAVPWSAVGGLLPQAFATQAPFGDLPELGGSPIVSVELWLNRVVVGRVMVGLRDSEVEWVFDKGRLYGREGPPQHLAFIISAAHRSTLRSNAELQALAEAALRRYFPAMKEAAVTRALVLREPQATFASDPERERLRPGNRTPIRGLYLAGDWTATGLPATIEGAVRSGRAAARLLEQDLG